MVGRLTVKFRRAILCGLLSLYSLLLGAAPPDILLRILAQVLLQ